MKKIFLFIFTFSTFFGYSQEPNIVELISVGRGRTNELALQNAMKIAIEQSFGVFVSTKTEILNDELIKDQIISVSNGSIQKYEIISERSLSENSQTVTIKATVSINKLISFVQGKGVSADFNGSLFSFNIRQQELNEKNEKIAIEGMISVIKQLLINSLDYNIVVSNPVSVLPENLESQERMRNRYQYQPNQKNTNENWYVPVKVEITANENFKSINSYLYENLTAISLNEGEASNYLSLKKNVFPIDIDKSTSKKTRILLRTEESITSLFNNLSYLFYDQALSFSISEKNIDFNYIPNFSNVGIFIDGTMVGKRGIFIDRGIQSNFLVVPYHLYENGISSIFNVFDGYHRKYMSHLDEYYARGGSKFNNNSTGIEKSINKKLKFIIPYQNDEYKRSGYGSYFKNSIDLLKYSKPGYHIADINYYFKFDLESLKKVTKFTIAKITE